MSNAEVSCKSLRPVAFVNCNPFLSVTDADVNQQKWDPLLLQWVSFCLLHFWLLRCWWTSSPPGFLFSLPSSWTSLAVCTIVVVVFPWVASLSNLSDSLLFLPCSVQSLKVMLCFCFLRLWQLLLTRPWDRWGSYSRFESALLLCFLKLDFLARFIFCLMLRLAYLPSSLEQFSALVVRTISFILDLTMASILPVLWHFATVIRDFRFEGTLFKFLRLLGVEKGLHNLGGAVSGRVE